MHHERLSYVREMRRNRARRIAIARLAHTRRDTGQHSSADTAVNATPGTGHTVATTVTPAPAARKRPLIYLGRHGHSRRRAGRLAHIASNIVYPALWAAMVVLGTLLTGASTAQAAGLGTAVDLPKDTLTPVIEQLRMWLVVVLAAIATLFFVLGGLRYLASNGDPGEIERAKSALKSSAIGYALALTAPIFIGVVTALFPAQK